MLLIIVAEGIHHTGSQSFALLAFGRMIEIDVCLFALASTIHMQEDGTTIGIVVLILFI